MATVVIEDLEPGEIITIICDAQYTLEDVPGDEEEPKEGDKKQPLRAVSGKK